MTSTETRPRSIAVVLLSYYVSASYPIDSRPAEYWHTTLEYCSLYMPLRYGMCVVGWML